MGRGHWTDTSTHGHRDSMIESAQWADLMKIYKKKNNNNLHYKNIGQSGGASRWRVCYQRGLPRLVYSHLYYWQMEY